MESTMKEKIQVWIMWLREKMQEKETQISTMELLSMEALQCKKPSKSVALFLKEQWLQFQIKTLAQHGFVPFQDYKQFIEFCNNASME